VPKYWLHNENVLITYVDTSFLFSLYVADSHSTYATGMMSRTALPVYISDFGEFEFANAVYWQVFLKNLRSTRVRGVLNLLSQDVQAGVIHISPISASAIERAKQVSRANTSSLGCRALDVLHVGCAIALQAEAFYTFDQRQAKLASAVGLKLR
jgi:predicted nucleic acid-binding protein